MRCVQKASRLKLYLPRQKLTINETLIFFKVVLLIFNILIPVYLWSKYLKLFLYDMKQYSCIYFNVFMSLILNPKGEFSTYKKINKKSQSKAWGLQKLMHLHNFVVSKRIIIVTDMSTESFDDITLLCKFLSYPHIFICILYLKRKLKDSCSMLFDHTA